MSKEKLQITEGPILRQMITFGTPILLMNLTQRLFNAADLVLTSWLGTSGTDAVAAIGATTSLTGLLINFFGGCAGGSAVAVSHALGGGKKEVIQKTVHTAVLLSVFMGAILSLLGLTLSEPILRWMGTPENLMSLSVNYLRAYFLGMIPMMVYNFGASILRAAGETKKPFYFLLVSGPVKLLLTVLFVSVWKLDVAGLALATTCSQAVAALLVLIALLRRKDSCRLKLKALKFHVNPLKRILYLGIPAGIQSSTFALSGVVIQSSVNSLSHLEGFLAGNAAAVSLETFADGVTSAYFQIGMTFVGQNYGAHNFERIRETHRKLGGLTVVFTGLVSLFVLLLREPILGLYLKGESDATYWGEMRVIFYFLPLIFQGLMDTTNGCIRGMGASVSTMVVTMLGACGFRILWLLTVFRVPAWHTPACLYISYPLAWVITYLAELMLYRIVYKRETKLLITT